MAPSVSDANGSAAPNGAPGSQTLARGLAALQLVATSPSGLTVQQVADDVGVHRTIAYRLLSTLAQFRLVAKGEDGRYRSAAALAVLGASFDNNVRQLSVPTLRGLADELGTTVSLLVAEGDQQVAIAVIVPTNVFYQLSFHEGSRYPLDRGAAGIALLASMPPRPGERDLVPQARQQGWVITHGEVEPNTYGLAVPVRRRPPSPPTCINLISHREDVSLAAGTRSSRPPTNYPRSSAEGMNTVTDWDIDVDVVVLGSGGAGLTAALTAATNGASVAVYEKAATVGGTTAVSGGIVWIPAHQRASDGELACRGRDGLSACAVTRVHGRRPDGDVRAHRPGDARLRRGAQRSAVRGRRGVPGLQAGIARAAARRAADR